MGVEIIADGPRQAFLYCNTSEVAFGPKFNGYEEAEQFISWLPVDPRSLEPGELAFQVKEWRDENHAKGKK